MSFSHVVVDGSNIATEGRSTPSLAQLDEAVREFRAEYPQAEITVVVDATFGHRIDPSERQVFDEGQAHGELISPPAGAIGRGDAFLLRIADRSGATVLSNDSFQEFHGEYEWLFTKGRLIGGKPVPGVGWIFTPRNPVRGPKSRESVREARRSKVRIGSKEASRPMPVPKAPPPRPAQGRSRAAVSDAIAAATEEAVSPKPSGASRRRRRRGGGPPPEAVNDPLTFIQFIAEHPLGTQVEGEVDSFSSHGAFVTVGAARCYVPLSALGDPPPRAAREVLERGSHRTFVLQALDPQRRGIELALPGFEQVSGSPQQETVEAEIAATTGRAPAAGGTETPGRSRAATKKSAASKATGSKATGSKATGSKATGSKATAPRKARATKRAAEPAAEKKVAKKVAPRTTVAGQPPVEKVATKTAAARKTSTTKATAEKPAAKKVAPKKAAAKEPVAGKAATKKAAAKKAAAKEAAPKKAAPKKAVAAKTPAKKAVAAKASAKGTTTKATASTARAGKSTAKTATSTTVAADSTDEQAVPAKAVRKAPKKAAPKKAAAKAAGPGGDGPGGDQP